MEQDKIRELISNMVRLLITYEIELTAYQTVYQAVSDRLLAADLHDIDLRKMLVHVASSLPLQTEAEAEYAAIFGVMQEINSQTLDDALNSIRQTIDLRDGKMNQ
jgi:uncharacterized protein YqgV (UPF0045/DUF77 family)